jgi:regulator of replication initiation timing
MGLIEDLKETAALAYSYKQMDLYERIMGLRESVQSLREERLEISERCERLTVELATLRAEIATEQELVRVGNTYYLQTDTAQKKPYCITCWDSDRKLISQICVDGYHPRCDICVARKRKGT